MTSQISPILVWEQIAVLNRDLSIPDHDSPLHMARSKIPGGWLVSATGLTLQAVAITFVPDPEHKWDGNSLP
jgi:uncharacterized protein YcsI (UPF0317 family)